MLNLVVVVFSLAVLSAPSSVDGAERQRVATSRSDTPLEQIERTYDELRAMPTSERRQTVANMPAAQQSAVWSRHLLTMLVEHPEFTEEQRAVVHEALQLLTPELFEISPSSPEWQERVDAPLRAFKERVLAAFPQNQRAVVRELFTQLGSNVAAAPRPKSGRPGLVQADYDYCDCSVASDWCGYEMECMNTWCTFKSTGCGTFFRYACEGLCRPT